MGELYPQQVRRRILKGGGGNTVLALRARTVIVPAGYFQDRFQRATIGRKLLSTIRSLT
jgi:hypothetical protein